jgi:hypothetical protein
MHQYFISHILGFILLKYKESVWCLIYLQELSIFAVPLVNYHALKRRITNFFLRRKKDSGSRAVIFRIGNKCAECNETPVLPHHMGCGHVFCFYCIKVRVHFFVYASVFHISSHPAMCCLLGVPYVCGGFSSMIGTLSPIH